VIANRTKIMVDRVILDTMVYDAVENDQQLKQLIRGCQDAGHISIFTTHVQKDQLAQIPPEKDVGQASAVAAMQIATSVTVIGYSRIGQSRIGGNEENDVYSKLRINNSKHTEDAIIGTTAYHDADILVTDDKGFRNRLKNLRSRVKVMSSAEFKNYLHDLLGKA
jgi:rRNA-processing protein FCF1